MANLRIRSNDILYELLYSNSVLLLKQDDIVIIDFEWLGVIRTFEFKFTSINNVAPYTVNWTILPESNNNKVLVTLNKWNSDVFVENIEPLVFTANNTVNELKIKIRVTSKLNDMNNFCKFEVSIYGR